MPVQTGNPLRLERGLGAVVVQKAMVVRLLLGLEVLAEQVSMMAVLVVLPIHLEMPGLSPLILYSLVVAVVAVVVVYQMLAKRSKLVAMEVPVLSA
jgi:hypothetical protein